MSFNTLNLIKQEFQDLQMNPIASLGVVVGMPDENNPYLWQCTMIGPTDTSFAGGLFYLKIIFPDDYPNSKPEILFLTPIYHLNVKFFVSSKQPLGHICVNTLNDWNPGDSVKKVLPELFTLLHKNNPDSPYDDGKNTRRNEFVNNRALFEKKAKYFTKKYATPFAKDKEYPNGWDFTYNG